MSATRDIAALTNVFGESSPGAAAINSLQLPMMVIDLDDCTIRAVSTAALQLVGRTADQLIGEVVWELYGPEAESECRAVLELLRNSPVDFYRMKRQLRSDGSRVTAWVHALEFDGTRFALVQLAIGDGPRRSPLSEYFGVEPSEMAIGTTDPSWTITSISSDVDALLGIPSDHMIGRSLLGAVQESDVSVLLEADLRRQSEHAVGFHVRIRDASGSWRRLCCIINSMQGGSGRCFMLVSDPDPHPTAARSASALEHHLLRIAAEVEASGILNRVGLTPDAGNVADLSELSVRQWEVLSRLLQGERVPTIATELFVSQSTVRGHLASIFKRFNVGSQAELLHLLRGDHAQLT